MTSRLLPLAVACLGLLAGGCIGLFDPARPEPPSSSECATDFTGDYGTPTRALETLADAMTLRIRGRCAYIDAFADSAADGVPFLATFPAEIEEERRRSELAVPRWTRPIELVFYADFMELSDGPLQLTWLSWPEAGSDLSSGPGDSTLFRRYQVTPRGAATLLAAGTARLTFQRLAGGRLPAGSWALTRWEDGVDLSRLDPDRDVDEVALRDLTLSQRRLEAFDANF